MLALAAITCLAMPAAFAQRTGLDCRQVGVYRICGAAHHARQFEELLDFRLVRRRGHQAVRAELARTTPAATLTELPRNHPLSNQWQVLTDRIGYVRSFNELDPMAMEMVKGSALQTALLQAMKERDIFMSVDLSKFPGFLTVHRPTIERFCNRFLDTHQARRTFSTSVRRMAVEECFVEATGNVSGAREDDGSLKMLYFAHLSFWGSELLTERLSAQFRSVPRTVYLIHNHAGASPRSTSVGDLYLPASMAASPQAADLDLVLLHEAMHVRYGGFGSLTKMLFSHLPQVFGASDWKAGDEEKFKQVAHALLRQQAAQEEFTIDAHVIAELYDRPRERRRYAELIKRFEIIYPERAEAIDLLNQLADTVRSPESVFALQAAFASGDARPRGFTEAQENIYRRWMDTQQRFMAAALTTTMQNLEPEKKRDPMQMEEEVVTAARALFSEYEKLIERHRRK